MTTTAGDTATPQVSRRRQYQREQYRKRRLAAGYSKPASVTPECAHCGERFERVRRQRFCSAVCASAGKLTRDRTRLYGVTVDELTALIERQSGACAICSRVAPLDVDHCHGSQRVRGLLCRACNLGLGHFQDDRARLRRAITYLEGAPVDQLPMP